MPEPKTLSLTVWVSLQRGKSGGLLAKLYQKRPVTVRRDTVAVQVTLSVPASLFREPQLVAEVDVDPTRLEVVTIPVLVGDGYVAQEAQCCCIIGWHGTGTTATCATPDCPVHAEKEPVTGTLDAVG
jgi:hypothetical protein